MLWKVFETLVDYPLSIEALNQLSIEKENY